MFTSLKRMRKKVLLVLATLALVTSAATATYAVIFPIESGDGYSYWLSCGSSAGNYFYKCDSDGCVACDTCGEQADEQCALRGY